jgi:hypothetical protein
MKVATMIKGAAAAALIAVFASAQAAPAYCSAGTHPDGLDVSNMTLSGLSSSDCYGAGSMNNNATATTTAAINALAWGGGFTFLVRDEGNGGAGAYQGLQFSLSANAVGASSGTYTLTVTDGNGGAPLNLPAMLDLVGVLKGGTDYAAYLFDDLLVSPGSQSGTFTLAFVNGGGQFPTLSHLDLLIRDGSTPVPEPATAALLGIGLLALARIAKRKGK